MRGSDIPMKVVYTTAHTGKKAIHHREPMYTLQSAEEVKAKQDKLGKNAGWYYGTWCKKCCGVYPAFFTDNDFEAFGYYVCLVCGKESLHEPMPWQCRDDWNAGKFKWQPTEPFYEQMTIFDWLEEK